MKIALLNPWYNSAENELQERVKIAANGINEINIRSFSKNSEIECWSPDAVLSLAVPHAKATRYLTALAFWTPISRIQMNPKFRTSLYSFDVFLTPTKGLADYAKNVTSYCRKPNFDLKFWPSCYQAKKKGRVSSFSWLTYSGNNWDDRTNPSKSSIGNFFHYAHEVQGTRSDNLDLRVFGPARGWRNFPKLYQGSIPFDGKTFIDVYSQSGVILCLQSDKHYNEGIPSMRIFDACAAGCLAICDDTEFIKEAYGDTVLYVDRNAPAKELYEQVAEHLNWAKENPKCANEMVEAAQTIFNQTHAFEKTLMAFFVQFDDIKCQLGYSSKCSKKYKKETVDVIVSIKHSGIEKIQKTLLSLSKQTTQSFRIIFLVNNKFCYIEKLLKKMCIRMDLNYKIVISSRNKELQNNVYFEGLLSVTSKYFCILDNNELSPNHFTVLLNLLINESADIVYAGTTRVWEGEAADADGKLFEKQRKEEIRNKQLGHPDDDQYLLFLEDCNEKKENENYNVGPGAWLAKNQL